MISEAGRGERRGVWALLETPAVYQSLQWTLGAHRWRRALVREYARPREGEVVLDLGCGTGDLLPYVEAGTYVGLDRNARYIAAAQRRFPNRGRFIADDVGNLAAHGFQQVECVMAAGLLHHLDDESVVQLMAQVCAVLTPGGRLVTLDPCFRDGQHPIARLLAKRDRGAHVRTAEAYRQLAAHGQFRSVSVFERNDLLHLPCDYAILICHR